MGTQTNIYDNRVYFALQFRNEQALILEPASRILEPMNWEKMINHILRDSVYYGFWSDFIEDKYGLCFTFEKGKFSGGGDFLKNIYDTYGDQAEVYFSIGYCNWKDIPYKEVKSWRVNLQEYELEYGSDISQFGGVLTSIEKMPFQGKLKARMSSACTINQYINMDGDLLTPIPVETLRLHSKTLQQESIFQTQSPTPTPESSSTFFDGYLFLQPDQSNVVVNELNQVFTQPSGISIGGTRLPEVISSVAPTPISGGSGVPVSPPPYTFCGIYTGTASFSAPKYAIPPFTYGDTFQNQVSQYNPTTSGILTVKWLGGGANTSFYFYKGVGAYPGTQDYWTITPRLVVQRLIQGVWTIINEVVASSQVQIISTGLGGLPAPTSPMTGGLTSVATAGLAYILPSVMGATPRGSVAKVQGYTFNVEFDNISVIAGDCVYVHLLLCTNGTTKTPDDGWIQVDNFFNTITYSQLTTTPGSTSDGYRIFDVINQQIENLTGQENALVSDFFSQGGFGYKYLLTNGYALRNFAALINQPKKSLQSLINDMCAIFCLGIGIQEDVNGIETLIIDYLPNFFKTLVIATYPDTFECKDKHSVAFSFNKFKFGFNKWQGLNLVMEDEFNTQGEYLTQFLKYGDRELQQLSDTIASGYIIEEQRRNQFQLGPQQSLTEDESWFIIATAEPNKFSSISLIFANALSRVGFGLSSMALLQGDQFNYSISNWVSLTSYQTGYVVSDPGHGNYFNITGVNTSTAPHSDATNWTSGGGVNSGVVFTIQSEVDGYPQIGIDLYQITPAPTDEVGKLYDFVVIPPSPNQVFAERNQPFKICSGVIDPSTIYNGRLSLKHILYNWSPLISVGLYFIDPLSKDYAISQIVTTLVKMNSRLVTQFLPSEPNKGNVGDLVLNEFNRENISNLTAPLFSPIQMECKVRIGWNDMDLLRQALSGETGIRTKDFGGLVLKDASGDFWFCHVIDLKYDLVKETLTLTVQKVKLVNAA